MNDNKSFQLYKDLGKKLTKLNREEKGAILEAIFAYENGESVPDDMPLGACIAWDFIKPMLEAAVEKYAEISEARAEAGRKGMEKRWQNNKTITNDNKVITNDNKVITNDNKAITNDNNGITKDKRIKNKDIKEKDSKESKKKAVAFTPPTVDEVRVYLEELKSSIDAERFVDFYASKGWKVGSTKMVDWKATARNWERRQDKDVGKSDKLSRAEQDAFIMSLED